MHILTEIKLLLLSYKINELWRKKGKSLNWFVWYLMLRAQETEVTVTRPSSHVTWLGTEMQIPSHWTHSLL
jgi:hypothetical protein